MKMIKAILITICATIVLWMVASYMEVISTNMEPEPDPSTSEWNYFQLLGKEGI